MLRVLWVTRDVLIWAAIAVFLAMALNPAVEWLQARGIRRRGLAVGIVFVGAVLGIAAVGALFVPTLSARSTTSRRPRPITSMT